MATTAPARISRTIRLRKRLVRIHMSRRRKKSVDYVREDIARHAKAGAGSVKMSKDLNNYLVDKVARSMSPVRVTVERDGDIVKADLAPELKRRPEAADKPAEKKAPGKAQQEPAKGVAAGKAAHQHNQAQQQKAAPKQATPSDSAHDKKVK
ncbi:MAG: hypothetical protein M1321_01770 [Candidatus Marsarchaeota archaeon]|jgi:ribosomal protein L31E|nr:hypothetical protein [Candidatus Marsarchaeota archaeon]